MSISNGSFDGELAAFASELNDLYLACGRPGHAEIVRRARPAELSKADIGEALSGKRLPQRDSLITLVRILIADGDGAATQRIGVNDPRLTRWSEEWTRLSRLQEQSRRLKPRPSPAPYPQRAPSRPPADFELPSPDAPRHELDAAKEGLRDIIASLETHAGKTEEEFRELLDERSHLKAEIRRLKALLEKDRDDNAGLKKKLAHLSRQYDLMDGQVAALRQQLHDLTKEKLDLVEEEKELITWQYHSNYEWGRFEQRAREQAEAALAALRTETSTEIARLTGALVDSERKLEAADGLIHVLRNH
ncbi:hypothetical protein [Streptomyces sp. NPDC050263]|uniref:hypothetical protein n=1 Tax=Streptomyces sp. NPDC050263 TaxID=3155037 RepID=UPI003417E1F8